MHKRFLKEKKCLKVWIFLKILPSHSKGIISNLSATTRQWIFYTLHQKSFHKIVQKIKMASKGHKLAFNRTLALKASHSRSYWRLVSTERSSDCTHFADRRSRTAFWQRPVKIDSPRGCICVSWPQKTPRHLRNHFSVHL